MAQLSEMLVNGKSRFNGDVDCYGDVLLQDIFIEDAELEADLVEILGSGILVDY